MRVPPMRVMAAVMRGMRVVATFVVNTNGVMPAGLFVVNPVVVGLVPKFVEVFAACMFQVMGSVGVPLFEVPSRMLVTSAVSCRPMRHGGVVVFEVMSLDPIRSGRVMACRRHPLDPVMTTNPLRTVDHSRYASTTIATASAAASAVAWRFSITAG